MTNIITEESVRHALETQTLWLSVSVSVFWVTNQWGRSASTRLPRLPPRAFWTSPWQWRSHSRRTPAWFPPLHQHLHPHHTPAPLFSVQTPRQESLLQAYSINSSWSSTSVCRLPNLSRCWETASHLQLPHHLSLQPQLRQPYVSNELTAIRRRRTTTTTTTARTGSHSRRLHGFQTPTREMREEADGGLRARHKQQLHAWRLLKKRCKVESCFERSCGKQQQQKREQYV